MNDILTENEYRDYIISKLVENNSFEERSEKEYDRLYAVNPNALMRFLEKTQPEKLEILRKIHKNNTEKVIINTINSIETTKSSSRLDILKHGIDISYTHLDLVYDKPASNLNKETVKPYKENIFTVSKEVWASGEERIDLVIFLNGIAIMAFELKCELSGQNYEDAIKQWREERNPKTRLFRWKSGVLVCFAMDLSRVYMTTKVDGASTFFLPFNQGSGEGINAGEGNPILENDYSVHYMWDNILTKDSILEIIRKFMFIEVKKEEDPTTKKEKVKETIIFPRYHQLDVVRKLLVDVKENHTLCNYLLQHSTGSGKTNEIAWLSYRLASLYDNDDKNIFDSVIICTDRVIVDRQLQDAINMLEHKQGRVKTLDSKCSSGDLKTALESDVKIIVTTIQKFPYIVDSIATMKNKHFAVIIDEAHSSTAGKNMVAITQTLGSDNSIEYYSVDDIIDKKILLTGKQPNVSMFAFTATPKATTLQLFGTTNEHGQKQAFHIYSMKQAIEEGFILDVLQNYVTYETFYKLNKIVEDDPSLKTDEAKRKIARFIELSDTNIEQRIEIIIEHFRTTVMPELGGQAKAMVVTESRAGAVKYRKAFEDYITRKGYTNIHALVAFSGKVTVNGSEYKESTMNGFSEAKLRDKFDTDQYQVLIVADKYQTGFDQKKLCAMYILKKLHGVSVVQTLSRLNRIFPPFDKKTFILDFANDYSDITKAFAPYYTCTIVSNNVTPASCYDIYNRLLGYYVFYESDIEDFVNLRFSEQQTSGQKKKMISLLEKSARDIRESAKQDPQRPKAIKKDIRAFIRCYEFLIQVTSLNDRTLHKMYIFLGYLKTMLEDNQPGQGIDISDKIKATDFVQKKKEEHKRSSIVADPNIKLSNADKANLAPEKRARLSEIIAEINSRTGKLFDDDVVYAAVIQIKELMKKNADLRRSAKTNTLNDFAFTYNDKIDEILLDGLDQNKDFYSLLLDNNEIKHEFMDIFTEDVYESCGGKGVYAGNSVR